MFETNLGRQKFSVKNHKKTLIRIFQKQQKESVFDKKKPKPSFYLCKSCAYYNPEVDQGGPHPEHPIDDGFKLNNKGEWVPRNERKRRDDDFEDDYGDDYDPEDEENLTDCDGSETGVWKDLCENNFDQAGEGQIQARRKKKVSSQLSVRINSS